MTRKFNVYGIGNALMDLQIQITEAEFNSLGLKKGGMQLVSSDEQGRILEIFNSRALHQTSGGSAANSLIALAQLGGRGAYGCLVGHDRFGVAYQEEMLSLGIALPNVPLTGKTTGTCLILITPDAERTLNTSLGVSAEFSANHVSESTIADSEWLYIEGYLLTNPQGQEAARKAVQFAKANGTRVAVTFSDTFIVTVFRDALTEIVKSADLLFANYHEASAFADTEDEDRAFRHLCDSAPNAIMTLSERGARLSYAGQELHSKPFPVKAIDNTGAGDMFAGAFLYGQTQQYTPAESAALACFLSSRVVSQLGPRLETAALSTFPELRQLMHSRRDVRPTA